MESETTNISCPGEHQEYSIGNSNFKHLLLKEGDIIRLAGLKAPDSERLNLRSEGYRCICGTIVGIRKSDGHAVPLCRIETQ